MAGRSAARAAPAAACTWASWRAVAGVLAVHPQDAVDGDGVVGRRLGEGAQQLGMGGLELLEEDLEVGVAEERVVEDPQPHRQASLLLGEPQGVAVGRQVGHEVERQLAVLRAHRHPRAAAAHGRPAAEHRRHEGGAEVDRAPRSSGWWRCPTSRWCAWRPTPEAKRAKASSEWESVPRGGKAALLLIRPARKLRAPTTGGASRVSEARPSGATSTTSPPLARIQP